MSRRMHIRNRRRQRGVGLVELMVALVLSLFLIAGLFTIFFSTRRSYNDQQALAAMQDNETLAASILANTVRAAGYFPYGTTYTSRSSAFAANTTILGTSGTWSAGQVIYATGTTAAASQNTLTVRMIPSDALNCLGASGTTVQQNTFSIDGTGDLECSVDGASAQPLISPLGGTGINPNGGGVQDMKVMIGVSAGGGGSVTNYYAPNAMPSKSDWQNARTVVVTLTFFNPLFDAAHTAAGVNVDSQGQPRYLSLTRVIRLENLAQ